MAVSQECDYNQGESSTMGEKSGTTDADGLAPYLANETNTRASVQSRSIKCVNHFNYYLLEHRRSHHNILTISLDLINNHIYKGFVQYLGKDARAYCNPANERLSHQTSDNYLSGIKSVICERALKEKQNTPFGFFRCKYQKISKAFT